MIYFDGGLDAEITHRKKTIEKLTTWYTNLFYRQMWSKMFSQNIHQIYKSIFFYISDNFMINWIVNYYYCIFTDFVNCSNQIVFFFIFFFFVFRYFRMITLHKCVYCQFFNFFFSFAFFSGKTWQTFWPTQWLTKLSNLFCGIFLRKKCVHTNVYIRFGIFALFFCFSIYYTSAWVDKPIELLMRWLSIALI